jgi:serine protease inhibitor
MRYAKMILPAALALVLSACQKTNVLNDPSPTPVPVESVAEVARMNQALGWKVFQREHQGKPTENVLISPLSIQTALFMANNGTQGSTRAQMLALMECPNCAVGDLNKLHRDLRTLLSAQSGHPRLTLANRFFYDKNRISVQQPFLDALGSFYAAEGQNADFNAEQAALSLVNGWVNTNTNGKIPSILERIGPLDVAFLINALHFKADWATGFAEQLTQTRPFLTAGGSTVNVPFFNADRYFTFAQTPLYHMVDIPFRDSTYSLSCIMPTPSNSGNNWVQGLTPEVWKSLYDAAVHTRAIVHVPKMKLAYDNDLVENLRALGMVDAFSENAADFKPMGSSPTGKNIFIKQIKHKAVLEVDEKGAEGAAVTSIGFGITSLPPELHFNRSFVLVLRHVPTNTMVFTGFVANPGEG